MFFRKHAFLKKQMLSITLILNFCYLKIIQVYLYSWNHAVNHNENEDENETYLTYIPHIDMA